MKDFNMGKDLKGIWKGGQNARLEFKIDSTTNEQWEFGKVSLSFSFSSKNSDNITCLTYPIGKSNCEKNLELKKYRMLCKYD